MPSYSKQHMQVGQIPMAPVSHELTEPGYTYGYNPYAKLPEYKPSSYGRADDHDASLSFLQQGMNQQVPGAFTKPVMKAAAPKKISPAGKLGDMSGKIMSQPSSVPPSPTSIQD